MIRRQLLALLAGAVALPRNANAAFQEPTAAQPKLPTEKLVIVTRDGVRHEFTVEMALTAEQQQVGLMFRTDIPPDTGMLFDWGAPRVSSMWMRNTVSSLDMLFMAADGTIRHIAERTVPYSLAIVSSGGAARATLEVAAGTAERLDIRVGDKVLQRVFGNAP